MMKTMGDANKSYKNMAGNSNSNNSYLVLVRYSQSAKLPTNSVVMYTAILNLLICIVTINLIKHR